MRRKNDITYVNVANEIEVNRTWEFKNCYFQLNFLNCIISVIYRTKFTKFGTLIVEHHWEGTVSLIFNLGLKPVAHGPII